MSRSPSSLFSILLMFIPAVPLPAQGPMNEMVVPGKYILHYPVADRFCPPTRTTFADVAQPTILNKGRRVAQHPNGGFGKAMFQTQGQNMFHTGADISWFRLNEPVFAVASGVVRVSHEAMHAWLSREGKTLPGGGKGPWDWGNQILIEHRLPDGTYFTTLYAHLGNDRLVQAGDIVQAGQQIGTIGAKNPKINGGYEPHLHFGVLKGRLAQPGNSMFLMPAGGQSVPVTVVSPGEMEMTVTLPENAARVGGVILAGKSYDMTHTEGSQYTMASDFLWKTLPMNMPMAGYQPALGAWMDPLEFLKTQLAGGQQASPLYYTHDQRSAVTQHPVGRTAPLWDDVTWLNRETPLEVADLKGKVVCVFCFQAGCKLSQSVGWRVLEKLLTRYGNDGQVQVVAWQTAFTNSRRNNETAARKLLEAYRLTIPVGHLESGETRPGFLDSYGIRATPWVILIDPQGMVQTSTFLYDEPSLSEEIERLKPPAQAE